MSWSVAYEYTVQCDEEDCGFWIPLVYTTKTWRSTREDKAREKGWVFDDGKAICPFCNDNETKCEWSKHLDECITHKRRKAYNTSDCIAMKNYGEDT